MSTEKLFQCRECGLSYKDQQTAKTCESYCQANQACSIEIAKHSVEYTQKEKEFHR